MDQSFFSSRSRRFGVAGLLALAFFSSSLPAASILLYRGPSDGGYNDNEITELTNLLVAGGNTVTTVTISSSTQCPTEAWGSYDQVWDFRFQNLAKGCPYTVAPGDFDYFGACWQSKSKAYLENCGRMYILAENSGFQSRDTGVAAFLQTIGAVTASFSPCINWGGATYDTWNSEADTPSPYATLNLNTPLPNGANSISSFAMGGMPVDPGYDVLNPAAIDFADFGPGSPGFVNWNNTPEINKRSVAAGWNSLAAMPGLSAASCSVGKLFVTWDQSMMDSGIYSATKPWVDKYYQGIAQWLGTGPCVCGTPSNTPTVTPTDTPSSTPSATPTATPSATPSSTPTATPSVTPTSTRTVTPTVTSTATPTATPSVSSTATATPSVTPSASPTPTATSTATPSATPTATPTATPSRTQTPFSTATSTATDSPTVTASPTPTPSATVTVSLTDTSSATPTPTPTPSATASMTPSVTATAPPTVTVTPTPTQTSLDTATITSTATPTSTPTPTLTRTDTATDSPTVTPTATPSATPSASASVTPSATATATLTPSPSVTLSPTITVTPIPMPYQLSIVIYNSAGEVVRSLFNGQAETLPGSVKISANAFMAGQGGVSLDLGGVLSGTHGSAGSPGGVLTWSGENNGGQTVGGGIYTMKIEYKDNFGGVTSFTQSVNVLPGSVLGQVNVFNSAGELVYTRTYAGLSATPLALNLDNTVMAAAFGAGGGGLGAIQGSLKMSSGPDQAFAWDGVGSNGQPVQAGVYTLQLATGTGSGTVIESQQVTVIKAASGGLAWEPKLGPNPAGPGVRNLGLSYPTASLGDATATLYDQAGERVVAAADPGSTGVVRLDLGHCAGGVYMVELRARLASGEPYRRLFKAAVLR